MNEAGSVPPATFQHAYIACGERALSRLPSRKIDDALAAPDVPAIWDRLGSDALDAYVTECRKVDDENHSANSGT